MRKTEERFALEISLVKTQRLVVDRDKAKGQLLQTGTCAELHFKRR